MLHAFALRFSRPPHTDDDRLARQIYDGGCSDALLGLGRPGRFVLEFERDAASAKEAVEGAVAQVLAAVPGARFLGAGLTAEPGCSFRFEAASGCWPSTLEGRNKKTPERGPGQVFWA